MFIRRQRRKISNIYREYRRSFWILVGATFIDRLGGSLLFPFFALYITRKFGVGMTEVGILFAMFSLSSFVGSFLGGALTDRIGRRTMLIFGLLASSFSTLLMGFVESLNTFYLLALLSGIFTDVAGPAHQAMVADLLPENKRAEGFGILRVGFNLAATIGPAIGGFLAAQSYQLLFITDAVISTITAGIVFAFLKETRPKTAPGTKPESVATTFRGYGVVLRDTTFMLFMFTCILMGLVYMNMFTTLGVFLRDVHRVPEAGYGALLSINAFMVVVLQFPITRAIREKAPLRMMALGMALYAIGFAMYGFVAGYAAFVVAMVIITFGEMIVAPVSQSLTAQFAPENMRGRYMAIFGFSWSIPFMVGPLLAGLVLDNLNPNYLWYAAGLIGLVATLGFVYLQRRTESRPVAVTAQEV
ncbi:MAG TPA: MFS transporter [Anaerolineae bacterium]|nr:MFS transporter [Anaerolineae bacterium]